MHFIQAGLKFYELAIFVIFDGIEKMNTNSDSNENIIGLFNNIDATLSIKG
jgi:hypothetical protein